MDGGQPGMTPRLPTTSLISRPRSHGFHARIGEVYVRLAPAQDRPYVVTAPESEPPRLDTAQAPEEFISREGQTFGRGDFTGGEGLAFAHRATPGPTDRTRFWDSANVRAPVSETGTPLYVDMTNDWYEYGTFTAVVAVVTYPDTEGVCIIESTSFTVLDDLDNEPTPNLIATGALTNTGATAAAALGDRVYYVNGSNSVGWIDSAGNQGTETTSGGNGSWARIWAAKGRLFLAELDGSSDNALYEYQPGTPAVNAVTATGVITDADAWTAVVDAGEYIAAGGTDGRIYFFAPQDVTTPTLVLYTSTPMPEGESVESLAYNQGVLLIGTSEVNWDNDAIGNSIVTGRLYQARVGAVVEQIQLIKRWDLEEEPVPTNMFTTRDSVYFTIKDGTTTELWRFLLPTLGLFREDRFTTGAASLAGMSNPGQVAIVALTNEVWIESGNVTDAPAWMILPAADFYTTEPKSWSEIRVDLGEMPTGSEIDILVSTEYAALQDWMDSSWRTVRTIRSTEESVVIPLTNVDGRYLIMQVRLHRGANFESPQVLAISATGKVKNDEDVEVVLPIIVSDRIEMPYRKAVHSRGLGEALRQYLFGLKGQTVDIEIFRPADQVRGWVTGVQASVQYINRRGHPVDTIQFLVSGRRTTGETVVLTGGTESLGVGLLGVEPVLGGVSA